MLTLAGSGVALVCPASTRLKVEEAPRRAAWIRIGFDRICSECKELGSSGRMQMIGATMWEGHMGWLWHMPACMR